MKRLALAARSRPTAQVPPGASREIVWKFGKPGTFAFGCLVPGHFEGGMKGSVVVAR